MALARKFITVGSGTLVSRVLGMGREVLMAAVLAAGPVADVFYTCFRFPNLFRRLFAEGAFNIAFVPMFKSELEKNGAKAARELAGQVFAVLASWLILFTIAALAFTPFLLAEILAPGFADQPEKFELSVTMTRFMFPYLMLMSVSAMFSGILNCLKRFFIAAFAPVLLNLVLIAVLCLAVFTDMAPRQTGLFLSFGVLLSGFLQLGCLTIGLYRADMTFRLTRPELTPKVKRLAVLMAPALLTGGVLQINLLIGTIIATRSEGANALINYADRLNQLPLGIIGIAIGTVLLPELVGALERDRKRALSLQNRSLEYGAIFALPASIGLTFLPYELVQLVYERGAFTAKTTALTAEILRAFAAGLPAYILIKVMQTAFFARQDMKTPFALSCLMVAINVFLSLWLFDDFGPVAIAIGTSVSAWVNFGGLTIILWLKRDFCPDYLTLKRVTAVFLSAVLMGYGIMVAKDFAFFAAAQDDFLSRLTQTGALVLGAAGLYFALLAASCAILGDREFLRFKRNPS